MEAAPRKRLVLSLGLCCRFLLLVAADDTKECFHKVVEGYSHKVETIVHPADEGLVLSNVTLKEHLSFYNCEKGFGFGFNASIWWVSRGCQGTFVVEQCRETGCSPRIYEGSSMNMLENVYPAPDGFIINSVVLVSQLSAHKCKTGVSFSHNTTTWWVAKGCSGTFRVDMCPEGGCRVRLMHGSAQYLLEAYYPATRGYSIERVVLWERSSFYHCNEGQGYGFNSTTWWVDKGCEGTFKIDECPQQDASYAEVQWKFKLSGFKSLADETFSQKMADNISTSSYEEEKPVRQMNRQSTESSQRDGSVSTYLPTVTCLIYSLLSALMIGN